MNNAFLAVEPAVLEWRKLDHKDGTQSFAPFSPFFNDIYFNTHDGIAESDYVFLQGNQLESRFHELNGNNFTIVETGFGSGLNFLLTCKLWTEQTATSQATLNYYSVEQYPISPENLEKIYSQLNIESPISQQLLNQYPPAMPGVYRITVTKNIHLHLIFLPLDKALKEIAVNDSFKVDAWYLDGFAPSKNPHMWSKGLLHFMALHAQKSQSRMTTVATFTAASEIRRLLTHYGFTVNKQKGFGFKREMITATFSEKHLSTPKPGRYSNFLHLKPKRPKVAIIGAGLAGCSSAYWLHQRGIDVDIFEQSEDIASGASKMPSLLAAPNISIDHNAFSQLSFAGFYVLRNYISRHPHLSSESQCLQLASEKYSEHQLKQYSSLYQSRYWQLDSAFKWHNLEFNKHTHQGLLMPAIQVNGKEYCHSLIEALPLSAIHLQHPIASLCKLSDYQHIIIANGHSSLINNLGLTDLPTICPLRGQLSLVPSTAQLALPINYDGQLFNYKDQFVLGATFSQSIDESIVEHDKQHNIQLASEKFLLPLSPKMKTTDYAGIRASTYDRFPFVGIWQQTEQQTIWLNFGYGTRGLNLSLLCSDVIAASINNETIPLPKNLLNRISPQRIANHN